MSRHCSFTNHIWTVETLTHDLFPELDLIPGRRCLCGLAVIVGDSSSHPDAGVLRVEPIDSQAARDFADANPALKTW